MIAPKTEKIPKELGQKFSENKKEGLGQNIGKKLERNRREREPTF